jgi:hypothetical protein
MSKLSKQKRKAEDKRFGIIFMTACNLITYVTILSLIFHWDKVSYWLCALQCLSLGVCVIFTFTTWFMLAVYIYEKFQ